MGLGYVSLPLPCLGIRLLTTPSPPGDSDKAHRDVYENDQKHEGKFSHELIGGAASFAAMKAFEDHQRKEGMSALFPSPLSLFCLCFCLLSLPVSALRLTLPTLASFPCILKTNHHLQPKKGKNVSHGTAKAVLAGFAGAEIDKLAETKGLDEADKVKAHHHAKQNAEHMYDDHYVGHHGADEYDPNRYHQHHSFNNRW